MKQIGIAFIITVTMISCVLTNKHASIIKGKYHPTWESLSQYGQAPDWFRDAKFGIWAHWGPQCQPEQGDWYGRGMYEEGSRQYNWHVAHYGHPSTFGFKDVIHEWKADKWNPEKLVALYKRVGAKYFFAMANHHDNLDLWDSKYQPWNSVNMGPKRNIIGEWQKAARKNGLPFGVSVHASHAWTWYETSQEADKYGPKAGMLFDGNLSKKDGKDKWWEGYNPQDLYAQNHALSKNTNGDQWDWGNGASTPSKDYCQKFLDRTIDLINKYNPDLIYFDDTALPLWPVSDVGLQAVSHYYNKSIKENRGINNVVVLGKKLNDQQKSCLVWDIEKGVPSDIQPKPWQTCTCIGNWHYDINIYNNNSYKTAGKVIHMLIDIISKNGNLLLNIPVKGNGNIDDKEEKILNDIANWMDVNNEGVFGTRPWIVYGEGPSTLASNPIKDQGFNEDKQGGYTPEDIRFVTKGNALYMHVLAWPKNGMVKVKALAKNSKLFPQKIKNIELLGFTQPLQYIRDNEALKITLPTQATHNEISITLKVIY